MKSFALATFFACFLLISGEPARYDNYRIYTANIENEQQLEILQALENHQDGILFLEAPVAVKRSADLLVAPHKFADITELFEAFNIKNEIKTENVQSLIDAEKPSGKRRAAYSWDEYYDLAEIYAFLDQLLEQHPDKLTNVNYGTSYENRTLRAVKLSNKKGNPTIFIESTIHAREWITVATATYILNELLTSDDAEIKALANNYDWVFVPVTNVDGYAYTHSTDRMWRKTRKPYGSCVGSDPNRNWDFHHGETGASSNPCAETYAGPTAFSEPETLAISEFIKTVENLKLYISFHSYSQLLLFPYGHTYDHAPNHDDMQKIGDKSKEAIYKRYQTDYTVGNIANTIYLASGSSIDWVYGTQNVNLTFTYEFRDKGKHGFILPKDQIIPNSLEVLDGLIALVKEAKALNYL